MYHCNSPCQCVCLCNRAPEVQPAVGQILPAAGPPSAAAQSTPRRLHPHHCQLCTAEPHHGPHEPVRYTDWPGTAKHQGCHLIQKARVMVCKYEQSPGEARSKTWNDSKDSLYATGWWVPLVWVSKHPVRPDLDAWQKFSKVQREVGHPHHTHQLFPFTLLLSILNLGKRWDV